MVAFCFRDYDSDILSLKEIERGICLLVFI